MTTQNADIQLDMKIIQPSPDNDPEIIACKQMIAGDIWVSLSERMQLHPFFVFTNGRFSPRNPVAQS